ncbi:hypothetical protein [Aureispira sp. CCB-QB1]|uniref:hypothetical protein n=1 Tax=Aureispira sp. CCB-QB1 TaxID=1313421 RepID=UPI0006967EFE|nr:hypothetical protein [Aureispira sp. CCB-QB1]
MIAQSNGFIVNGFKIPPFTLNKGDFILLFVENSFEALHLKEQLFLLFSSKKLHPKLTINENITTVANIQLNSIKEFFIPTSVQKYIYKNAKTPSNTLHQIVSFENIFPNSKITHLPGTDRKLISLLTTLSYTRNIIFDLGGLDPLGAEKIVNEVTNQLIHKGGAAILIDSFEGFENRCSQFLKISRCSQ